MKKLLFALFFGLLLSISCSKKKEDPAPADTQVKFTAIDKLGNAVVGATVRLYNNVDDLSNEVTPVATATTGAGGVATIGGLKSVQYAFLIESGCLTNFNNGAQFQSPITANQTNTAIVTLNESGSYKFINNSNNPYYLYVNGTYIRELAGKTSYTKSKQETGSYTFRVLQKSGYVFSPTDITYTGSITCSGTTQISFP